MESPNSDRAGEMTVSRFTVGRRAGFLWKRIRRLLRTHVNRSVRAVGLGTVGAWLMLASGSLVRDVMRHQDPRGPWCRTVDAAADWPAFSDAMCRQVSAWWWAALAVAMLATASLLTYLAFKRSRIIIPRDSPFPHAIVIVPVSQLRQIAFEGTSSAWGVVRDGAGLWLERRDASTDRIKLTGSIADDVATVAGKTGSEFNWMPILAGLSVHVNEALGKPPVVHLIGSMKGSSGPHPQTGVARGSFNELARCKEMIENYYPGLKAKPDGVATSDGTYIHMDRHPVDFEDVNELAQRFQRAMQRYLGHKIDGKRIREGDIIIDCTGGQKPTSIAAAIVTTRSEATFQYVSTSNLGEVTEYDMLLIASK